MSCAQPCVTWDGRQPLQTVSPVLRVEKDLVLQWLLHEGERAQVLSCVSDLNGYRVGCRLKNVAMGISPDSLLKVPMVLCNLVMLSFKFMQDSQGKKNKMTKLSSV